MNTTKKSVVVNMVAETDALIEKPIFKHYTKSHIKIAIIGLFLSSVYLISDLYFYGNVECQIEETQSKKPFIFLLVTESCLFLLYLILLILYSIGYRWKNVTKIVGDGIHGICLVLSYPACAYVVSN